MKTRIISAAVIIPVAIAILVFLPEYILAITLAVICAIAAYELFAAVNGTCKKTPSPRIAVYAAIGAVMMPFVVYFNALLLPSINIITGVDEQEASILNIVLIGVLTIVLILMCLLIVDFFLSLKSEKRTRLKQLLITPVAAIIIPYMLSSLIGLRMRPGGAWIVLIPVIITVLTDSGAYFTGSAIGKHKPLPTISPNKTVEGFIGGIVAGVLGMLIYGLILNAVPAYTVSIPLLLVYGAVGAVITELGDLAFSLIKRKCGIKDYGKLIPGHGGILDRFDSMIFNAPAMLLLVTLLPAVQ